MTFSTKFNAGMTLLPVGVCLLLTHWPEPLETLSVAVGLVLTITGGLLIISFLSKYDSVPPDERTVYTSRWTIAAFLLTMVIVLKVPDTVPPRVALPEVTGVYRGTERVGRRHRKVVIESDGVRELYGLPSTFFDELHSLDVDTKVTARLHEGGIADMVGDGRVVVAYDDYVKDYKNTEPMLVMFGLAMSACIYYTKRPDRESRAATGDDKSE